MVVLSRMTAILGVVALLIGIGLLVFSGFEIWKQWIAISASRSRDFMNPIPQMALGASVIAAGSFLTGLGLGMPKRNGV